MKQKIIKIAQDLKKGTITTETARTILLGLFGVSGSAFDERVDEEFDITKCLSRVLLCLVWNNLKLN